MNKIVLATGCMLAYSYAVEFFLALQSGDRYESATIIGRMTGPYAWACWLMLGCNALLPQLYWSRRIRTHVPAMLVISILINLGMWLERFVIIVTGQHRGFLPATWVQLSSDMGRRLDVPRHLWLISDVVRAVRSVRSNFIDE